MKSNVLIVLLLLFLTSIQAQTTTYFDFVFYGNEGCDNIFNDATSLYYPWKVSHGSPHIPFIHPSGQEPYTSNLCELQATVDNSSNMDIGSGETQAVYKGEGVFISYNFKANYRYKISLSCADISQYWHSQLSVCAVKNLNPKGATSCDLGILPSGQNKQFYFNKESVGQGPIHPMVSSEITSNDSYPYLWIYNENTYTDLAKIQILDVSIEEFPPNQSPNPPTNPNVNPISNCGAQLTWTLSTSTNVTGYKIYKNDNYLATVSNTCTHYQLEHLVEGTNYNNCYSVRAYNESGLSTPLFFSFQTLNITPLPPQSADVINIQEHSATLTWIGNSDPCVTKYYILSNNVRIATVYNSYEYTLSGLNPCQAYQGYSVAAADSGGLTSQSVPFPQFETLDPNRNAIIDGPGLLCTSAQYNIPTIEPGSTVEWSLPSGSPLAFNGSSTGQTVTISNTNWYPTATDISAEITFNSCVSRVIKHVYNTYGNPTTVTGTVSQPACYYNGIYYPGYNGNLNSPTFISPGCMATISLDLFPGQIVTFSGSTQPIFWNYVNYTLYVQLPANSGAPFYFTVSGGAGCNERQIVLFTSNSNSNYSIEPNPVEDFLVLNIYKENDEVNTVIEQIIPKSLATYKISINNLFTGNQVFNGEFNTTSSSLKLDVSKFQKGLYVMKINDGNLIQSFKFIKK